MDEAERRRAKEGGDGHGHAVVLVGGGGAYSFVACRSQLTIDHAALSRRNTVPTPYGDTSNVGRSLRFFLILIFHENFLFTSSPLTVCDRYLYFIY